MARLLLLVLLLLAAGCGTAAREPVVDDAQFDSGGLDAQTAQTPEVLLGRDFVSTEVIEDGAVVELLRGPVTVAFEARGDHQSLRWEAGCNTSGGVFEVTPERLEPARSPEGTAQFGATEQGCSEDMHEQDRWLEGVFGEGPAWTLDDDRLVIATERVEIEFKEGS